MVDTGLTGNHPWILVKNQCKICRTPSWSKFNQSVHPPTHPEDYRTTWLIFKGEMLINMYCFNFQQNNIVLTYVRGLGTATKPVDISQGLRIRIRLVQYDQRGVLPANTGLQTRYRISYSGVRWVRGFHARHRDGRSGSWKYVIWRMICPKVNVTLYAEGDLVDHLIELRGTSLREDTLSWEVGHGSSVPSVK